MIRYDRESLDLHVAMVIKLLKTCRLHCAFLVCVRVGANAMCKREQDIYEILRGNSSRVTSRAIFIIYRTTGPQLLSNISKTSASLS